jgi:hypothetical protein
MKVARHEMPGNVASRTRHGGYGLTEFITPQFFPREMSSFLSGGLL